MNPRELGTGRPVRSRRSLVLAFAVGGLLAAAASEAQNMPYQSQQRALIGTGLGQTEPPQGGYLEPRLDAAVQYANNINLAEESSLQDDVFGFEVSPGLYASYNSSRFMGAVDYSLIARAWDDSDYNDLGHSLAANGRWTAVPELLYVNAEAGYGDVLIDSRNGLNYGNLGIFGQGNLTEQATASISPLLRKRFSWTEFEASYSYGRVWYLDAGKSQDPLGIGVLSNDDSIDQAARVSFGTARDGRKLNGSIFYEWNNSDYERAVSYEYERAGFEGGFLVTRTLSIVGDVGRESSLDESTTNGGLDSDFWSAGLRWSPDPRTSAEARYGERFFGDSYSATITHRARMIDVTASYAESPSVQTRNLTLGEFDPGNLPPGGDPNLDGGRLNSQPYVGKDARVGVVAKGSRTTLTLDVFDSKRDFIQDRYGDEHGTGVSLGGSRQLASNLSVDATATYTDIKHEATTAVLEPLLATHDYDTQFILRGNRDFGPRLIASLEAGFLNRSGTSDYDGWWIGLRGRWLPSLR